MLKIQSPWGVIVPIPQTTNGAPFFIYLVPIATYVSRKIILSSFIDKTMRPILRWRFAIDLDIVSDFDSACEALTDAVLWLEEAEHLPMQTYHVVQD